MTISYRSLMRVCNASEHDSAYFRAWDVLSRQLGLTEHATIGIAKEAVALGHRFGNAPDDHKRAMIADACHRYGVPSGTALQVAQGFYAIQQHGPAHVIGADTYTAADEARFNEIERMRGTPAYDGNPAIREEYRCLLEQQLGQNRDADRSGGGVIAPNYPGGSWGGGAPADPGPLSNGVPAPALPHPGA